MYRLIIPDVQPDPKNLEPYNKRVEKICMLLESEHPGWLRLNEDMLVIVLNLPELFMGKTFIIPDRLIAARRYMTRTNFLVASMLFIRREFNWSFVIIASGTKTLDKRMRLHLEGVEEEVWGKRNMSTSEIGGINFGHDGRINHS